MLVTDYTWPSTAPEAEVLARVGARLLLAESGSEEELLRLVPGADAILTCFKQVSASVVRAGEKLQVIGRYGIGIDNIAVEEATRLRHPGDQRAGLLPRRGSRTRAGAAAGRRAQHRAL